MASSKAKSLADRVSNLRLIKRAMRQSKRRAMQKGLTISTDIAAFIIDDVLAFRGRANDDAVWWSLALHIVGNTRENSRHDDDDPQHVFDLDLPVPIRTFELRVELDDNRTAVQRDEQWVIVGPDGGDEAPADPEDVPEYMRCAKPHYVNTKVVEVRNFRIAEGDQRTRQMLESLARDHAAYDRWVKGWRLIKPLLEEHPAWTLGDAVENLRERDEWPSDLDDHE